MRTPFLFFAVSIFTREEESQRLLTSHCERCLPRFQGRLSAKPRFHYWKKILLPILLHGLWEILLFLLSRICLPFILVAFSAHFVPGSLKSHLHVLKISTYIPFFTTVCVDIGEVVVVYMCDVLFFFFLSTDQTLCMLQDFLDAACSSTFFPKSSQSPSHRTQCPTLPVSAIPLVVLKSCSVNTYNLFQNVQKHVPALVPAQKLTCKAWI